MAITLAAQTGAAPLYPHQVKTACKHAETTIIESKRGSVSPVVMASIIYMESRWTPKAESRKGACGLAQVIGKYVKRTCKQLKEPKEGIRQGVKAFVWWREWVNKRRRRKSLREALSCYSSGFWCLKSPRGRQYADRVLRLVKEYTFLVRRILAKKKDK
tara:strand:- start:4961 stop:5437 length:477 start_codon:yes stop_codon:yes gene_type:complete